MRGIVERGAPLVDDPTRLGEVTHLGVDETVFLSANGEHSTLFATGMVDTRPAGGGPARLLDVVPNRSGKAVADWLDTRGRQWRDGIAVAALDPFRGYHTALRSRLPGATVVLDCFHATRRPSTPLTRCVAGGRTRPSVTGAAAAIRSTASAGCCAAAPSG